MSDNHVCPWWLGPVLASPFRKIFQNPFSLLKPYVKEGMTAIDAGSAMGFFTIPMADLAGEKGKVIAVDLQEKMLKGLMKRAKKRGIEERIIPVQCSAHSLNLDEYEGRADFVLASAVLHEVPDQSAFLRDVKKVLKQEGLFLLMEPAGHVNAQAFQRTVFLAVKEGLAVVEDIEMKKNRAALLSPAVK